MPSAEDILKARDNSAESAAPEREGTQVEVDQAEQTPQPDRAEGLGRKAAPEPEGGDEDNSGDDGRQVPLKALHAEREKSKRYTEEVRDLHAKIEQLTGIVQRAQQPPPQPQQPPPQPQQAEFDWDNPALTIDQRVEAKLASERQLIRAEFQKQREATQSALAMQRHGPDAVKEAYVALATARENDPQWGHTYNQIMASPDQYEALVQWHRQRKALEEIGSDPEAYKARIRAEYLEELKSGKAMVDEPAEKPNGRTVMPSNLSAARSVASRNGAVWSGPTPLKDIFANR